MRNYNNLTPPPPNILFDSTKFTPIILCMFLEIEKFAPAKINIGLKVLPKTENQDYHQIESIFQTVNLRDRLCVKVIGGYDSCCVTCSNMALPKKNTITCAYEAFREVSGLKRLLGVHVELEKKRRRTGRRFFGRRRNDKSLRGDTQNTIDRFSA